MKQTRDKANISLTSWSKSKCIGSMQTIWVIFNTKALAYQNLSAVRELQQDRKPICPSKVMSAKKECCLSVVHEPGVWKSTEWNHILDTEDCIPFTHTCMWTALPSAGRVAVCQSVGTLRTSCYPSPSSEGAQWNLTLHSRPSTPAQSADLQGTKTTCQRGKLICWSKYTSHHSKQCFPFSSLTFC